MNQAPDLGAAAAVVDEYLRLLMIPDPAAARRFVAPGLCIRFTGGRAMRDPAECATFNAERHNRAEWLLSRVTRPQELAA